MRMGRFCVAFALLGLVGACGAEKPPPGATEDLLAVTQRIERQFANDQGELAGAKKIVHFTPDSGFNKLANPTVVLRATVLATRVHTYERDLSEQITQGLDWTKARICALFGWVEKVQRLKLTYLLGTEQQFRMAHEQDFTSRISPPSQVYDDAISKLYGDLKTVMGGDSEFAITAVVRVCELTETPD